MKQSITDLLQQRILILDGAMGTMIQKHKLQESDFRGEIFRDHPLPQKGNNDLLSLTRPDTIKSIYRDYLESGADILSTNTFNSNAISMSDYGMEKQVYNMNFQSAKLASEVIREYENSGHRGPHFIAGTLALQTGRLQCRRM